VLQIWLHSVFLTQKSFHLRIPEEFAVYVYGQDKLESLLTAYADGPNADVDHGECESEWEHFRILIQNAHI